MRVSVISTIISFGLLCLSNAAYSVELISNNNLQVESLSLNVARAIFSGRMKYWEDGTPVRVVMLNSNASMHVKFCSEVLQLYPRQLKRSWDMIVFSGGGEGPQIVSTEDELLKKVSLTAGAIGYIGSYKGDMEVKLVKVK